MLTTSRRAFVLASSCVLVIRPAAAAALEVWKSRGCACCSAWVERLAPLGLSPVIHEVDDLTPARAAAGVPDDLAGCHTARLDGYVLEGHVPPEAVRRLLTERPSIIGLAVPGMPMGSAGMEMEGMSPDPYDVIAFTGDGTRRVFMTFGG